MRHGEVDANRERRWHGSTNSKLNQNGQRQAAQLACYFAKCVDGIEVVYTSPLDRARSTAEQLSTSLNVPLVHHDALVEFGIGEFEGALYEDLAGKHDFFRQVSEDFTYAPPGGESVRDVSSRMFKAIDEIARKHKGGTLVLVGHGAAMGIVLSVILEGKPFPFHQYHMSNTGFSAILVNDHYELDFFNCSAHL